MTVSGMPLLHALVRGTVARLPRTRSPCNETEMNVACLTAAPITRATRARMDMGHLRWPTMRTHSDIMAEFTRKLAMAPDLASTKQ